MDKVTIAVLLCEKISSDVVACLLHVAAGVPRGCEGSCVSWTRPSLAPRSCASGVAHGLLLVCCCLRTSCATPSWQHWLALVTRKLTCMNGVSAPGLGLLCVGCAAFPEPACRFKKKPTQTARFMQDRPCVCAKAGGDTTLSRLTEPALAVARSCSGMRVHV